MNEAERWLTEWHDRRSGATARCFARGRPSSYAWLADLARRGDVVLDLACGDGPLLEMLLARGVAEATGVDMSSGELGAARARLGGAARLVQARAQALPFADASFDLVTCHLAFMPMSPVDEVVTEVLRVLRPGGRLAAVIGGGGPRPAEDIWTRMVQRVAPFEFVGPRIGDKRTYQEQGLRDLLSGFAVLRIEPLMVDLSGTPDDVWALWVDTYTFAMMKPEDLRSFEEGVRADCQELLRPDGTVPCSMGLLALSAVR
jgi:SAM-dependent methyltransferase